MFWVLEVQKAFHSVNFAMLNFTKNFSLLFLLPLISVAAIATDPVVEISNGRLEGFRYVLDLPPIKTSEFDAQLFQTADIFLGIPFAKPPLQELRLQKPVKPENWTDVLDASTIPHACVPMHMLAAAFEESEDCLYLNVMRPSAQIDSRLSGEEPSELFPVLVFIHGGGYNVGGSFVEGYANISNNFVSQGIVVVTIQYRIGFFGFFSDGTPEFPGNLGLWDQRQALIWVQKNIRAFGGDPDNVTLWGQSAGGSSVSMLSLSVHTRELFHQAIEQSGSLLSPWALNDRVVEGATEVLNKLGCPLPSRGNSNLTRECLQNLDVDDIKDVIFGTEYVRGEIEIVGYNPRFDNDFFTGDFVELLTKAPQKPSMIGFNTHESVFLTTHYPDSVFAFDSPLTVRNLSQFGAREFIELIKSLVHPRKTDNEHDKNQSRIVAEAVIEELIQFYVNKKTAQKKDFRFYLEQYTLFLTDVQFIVPILTEARVKSFAGWPIYVYQFDHVNSDILKKLPFRAVVHAGEYPYTLGANHFGTFKLNAEDLRVRNFFAESFGNFVKTGDPSLRTLKWPRLKDNDTSLLCARIRPKSFIETHQEPLMQKLEFWHKLSQKYDLSQIQGFPQLIA